MSLIPYPDAKFKSFSHRPSGIIGGKKYCNERLWGRILPLQGNDKDTPKIFRSVLLLLFFYNFTLGEIFKMSFFFLFPSFLPSPHLSSVSIRCLNYNFPHLFANNLKYLNFYSVAPI